MSSEPRETSVRRVKPGAAITVRCARDMFVNALREEPKESAVRDAPQVDLNRQTYVWDGVRERHVTSFCSERRTRRSFDI